MKQVIRVECVALLGTLLLAGCSSQAPVQPPASEHVITNPPTSKPEQAARYDGAGHNYATAIQLAGASNPLAFSQKQQEWLWLHYRDWKKQGQALREKDGIKYDEVTLVNKRGETRVIYFRMPRQSVP